GAEDPNTRGGERPDGPGGRARGAARDARRRARRRRKRSERCAPEELAPPAGPRADGPPHAAAERPPDRRDAEAPAGRAARRPGQPRRRRELRARRERVRHRRRAAARRPRGRPPFPPLAALSEPNRRRRAAGTGTGTGTVAACAACTRRLLIVARTARISAGSRARPPARSPRDLHAMALPSRRRLADELHERERRRRQEREAPRRPA